MSNPNSMAPSPAPLQRPPFSQQNSSYRSDYGAPNGRPSPFNPQSPPMMNFPSPSPQQYSPQQYSQPPAAKRPRLSPDTPSPFPTSAYPQTPTGQAGSPVGGLMVNGTPAGSRPGLMAPPQRPPEKNTEDRNYDDILAGTGINIEEEARNLTRPDYFGNNTPQSSLQSRSESFEYQTNSFGRPGSSGSAFGSQQQTDGQSQDERNEFSAEERQQRDTARADWEAARHTQHPLWDMFLYGGNLNDRIRKISLNEHLFDPQAGVMVNTQKQGLPPVARVNGLEGASRVIDKGQAILDTGQKGERLSEVMKLVCLATKSRLTGLVGSASRLSIERRQHSKGKIPTEWKDIAVIAKPVAEGSNAALSPASSIGLKRTHSQANSEVTSKHDILTGPSRVAATLQKALQAERAAEEARRAKRAKRKAAANADSASAVDADADAAAALAAALDPEKKITKKERKMAESRFSEQQQHKSANEAARMAVSGLMSNPFGGKKSRTYDWMNKGSGSSPAATPGRPPVSTSVSVVGTPGVERPRAPNKDKTLGSWDEDKDPGVQARDVLLVLETDGRAARSYVRGYSMLES